MRVRLLTTLALFVGTLFSCQHSLMHRAPAQDFGKDSRNDNVVAGERLFKHEWTYEKPSLPEQGFLTEGQYRSVLRRQPGDGLGPMHNATSCEACHASGGGAGVNRNVTLLTLDPRSVGINKALKLSSADAEARRRIGKEIDELFPGLIAPNGLISMDVVVHESSARPFYAGIRDQLREGVPGGIQAEWFDRTKRTSEAIAERPVIAGRRGDYDYYLSQRNSPALFGAGLIDKVSLSQLRRIADGQQARTAGRISGRVGVGKFGWRAQTPSLSSFVAGACAGELGLQLSNTPQPPDSADPTYTSLGSDLDETQFRQLVSYIASIPAPPRTPRANENGHISYGRRLFIGAGCTDCHIANNSPAMGIYSDLLLHDMGDLLQAPSPSPSSGTGVQLVRVPLFPRDSNSLTPFRSIAGYYGSESIPMPYVFKRPIEPRFPWGTLPQDAINARTPDLMTWDMLQREWKTPPLWGVADTAPYLHDGRAKTLDAAIRWHGGEASKSAENYRSLSKAQRAELLGFLRSLQAPENTPAATAETFVQQEIDADDIQTAFARGY